MKWYLLYEVDEERRGMECDAHDGKNAAMRRVDGIDEKCVKERGNER